MSATVTTQFGSFDEVNDGAFRYFLMRCPLCNTRLALNEAQWLGQAPARHDCAEGYEATHNFRSVLQSELLIATIFWFVERPANYGTSYAPCTIKDVEFAPG